MKLLLIIVLTSLGLVAASGRKVNADSSEDSRDTYESEEVTTLESFEESIEQTTMPPDNDDGDVEVVTDKAQFSVPPFPTTEKVNQEGVLIAVLVESSTVPSSTSSSSSLSSSSTTETNFDDYIDLGPGGPLVTTPFIIHFTGIFWLITIVLAYCTVKKCLIRCGRELQQKEETFDGNFDEGPTSHPFREAICLNRRARLAAIHRAVVAETAPRQDGGAVTITIGNPESESTEPSSAPRVETPPPKYEEIIINNETLASV